LLHRKVPVPGYWRPLRRHRPRAAPMSAYRQGLAEDRSGAAESQGKNFPPGGQAAGIAAGAIARSLKYIPGGVSVRRVLRAGKPPQYGGFCRLSFQPADHFDQAARGLQTASARAPNSSLLRRELEVVRLHRVVGACRILAYRR
jgi:hypothetical protein